TYGTFSANGDGDQFPARARVADDFAEMAANGINSIRTYTVPPRWLLDLAQASGLRVLIGLSWPDHVAFLDRRSQRRKIVETVRAGVRSCAGHPAVLAYAIGNEIPAQMTRWHGKRRVERFLRRLYDTVKQTDPDALVTYVNYPSTEYLQLPFVDFLSFNVYL